MQGLIAILLALKKIPVIRYQDSSEFARKLAETVKVCLLIIIIILLLRDNLLLSLPIIHKFVIENILIKILYFVIKLFKNYFFSYKIFKYLLKLIKLSFLKKHTENNPRNVIV